MVQFTLNTYLIILEGINMKFLKCANVTDSVADRNILPYVLVYVKKKRTRQKKKVKSNELP